MITQAHKTCSNCREPKSVTEFYRNKSTRDGFVSRCKKCVRLFPSSSSEATKTRCAAWYRGNKEYNKARNLAWAQNNPEKAQAARERNKDARNAGVKRAVEKRKDYYAAYRKEWSDANKDRRAASSDKWAKQHPERARERSARYLKGRKIATPPWANVKQMRAFYILAAEITVETGVMHEVDHVVPILSKNVCGLHCEANMQVLSRSANARKSNSFTSGERVLVVGDIPCLR